ncbi:YdcF family protein [Thermosipho ferrireducens]|uniref:YdcF family protein n=1 Tax=Thermosipho ferrireducens TaxID=2571116 RepID=A0ABX7S7Y3_9BACT|nr:YdcF family protein [Thermosipho ferrireducens]QTA37915.1 YdcF family protein [Thermosipho ferrireducens]
MRQAFDSITDFIFMEDELEEADIILIPGGSHRELMEHAVKLYHEGLAKYILPSGGYNSKIPEYNSEWEFLHNIAIDLGIPNEIILKEDKATNTFENAKFSYEIIEKHRITVNKAILVCKTFHARRAYLTYKVFFPYFVKFIVSPVVDERDIRKDNWFLDMYKVKIVMNELVKIGKYFESYIIDEIVSKGAD